MNGAQAIQGWEWMAALRVLCWEECHEEIQGHVERRTLLLQSGLSAACLDQSWVKKLTLQSIGSSELAQNAPLGLLIGNIWELWSPE